MAFSILDFLTGFFLMNAMPHFLLGRLNVRFLSAFGFGNGANLAYSALNVAIALLLFHSAHGIQNLLAHGALIGAGAMLLIYYATFDFFHKLFYRN